MAENPASWGPVEQTIYEVITVARQPQTDMQVGLSEPVLIANALRERGLIVHTPELYAAIERGVDAPWDPDNPLSARDQLVETIMKEIGGTHADATAGDTGSPE